MKSSKLRFSLAMHFAIRDTFVSEFGQVSITKFPRLLGLIKEGGFTTGLLHISVGSSLTSSLSGQQLAVFQQSSAHEQSEQQETVCEETVCVSVIDI